MCIFGVEYEYVHPTGRIHSAVERTLEFDEELIMTSQKTLCYRGVPYARTNNDIAYLTNVRDRLARLEKEQQHFKAPVLKN